MSLFLHCGAGKYGNHQADSSFEELMVRARTIGLDMLQDPQKNACDVVCNVLAELEASPLTNAGYGSNLTRRGIVECDAGLAYITDELKYPAFAALGAVPGQVSPARSVLALCREVDEHEKLLPMMSPTRLLVGKEAWLWSKAKDLSTAKDETELQNFHVTPRALSTWNSSRESVQSWLMAEVESKRQRCDDTIGCICVDSRGMIAVCSSSGGPAFRINGRVGPAAAFGMGFFVDKDVATCTTGSGDFISRTLLANRVAHPDTLEDAILLKSEEQIGILRMIKKERCIKYDWAFNSPGLALAGGALGDSQDNFCQVLRKGSKDRISTGSWEIALDD